MEKTRRKLKSAKFPLHEICICHIIEFLDHTKIIFQLFLAHPKFYSLTKDVNFLYCFRHLRFVLREYTLATLPSEARFEHVQRIAFPEDSLPQSFLKRMIGHCETHFPNLRWVTIKNIHLKELNLTKMPNLVRLDVFGCPNLELSGVTFAPTNLIEDLILHPKNAQTEYYKNEDDDPKYSIPTSVKKIKLVWNYFFEKAFHLPRSLFTPSIQEVSLRYNKYPNGYGDRSSECFNIFFDCSDTENIPLEMNSLKLLSCHRIIFCKKGKENIFRFSLKKNCGVLKSLAIRHCAFLKEYEDEEGRIGVYSGLSLHNIRNEEIIRTIEGLIDKKEFWTTSMKSLSSVDFSGMTLDLLSLRRMKNITSIQDLIFRDAVLPLPSDKEKENVEGVRCFFNLLKSLPLLKTLDVLGASSKICWVVEQFISGKQKQKHPKKSLKKVVICCGANVLYHKNRGLKRHIVFAKKSKIFCERMKWLIFGDDTTDYVRNWKANDNSDKNPSFSYYQCKNCSVCHRCEKSLDLNFAECCRMCKVFLCPDCSTTCACCEKNLCEECLRFVRPGSVWTKDECDWCGSESNEKYQYRVCGQCNESRQNYLCCDCSHPDFVEKKRKRKKKKKKKKKNRIRPKPRYKTKICNFCRSNGKSCSNIMMSACHNNALCQQCASPCVNCATNDESLGSSYYCKTCASRCGGCGGKLCPNMGMMTSCGSECQRCGKMFCKNCQHELAEDDGGYGGMFDSGRACSRCIGE